MKIARYETDFSKVDDCSWFGVKIPDQMQQSVPSRKLQYAAGRYCVFQAMRQLGIEPPLELATGPRGAPVWPEGVTGSITHTGSFARAVVASLESHKKGKDVPEGCANPSVQTESGDFRIGIDSEQIMSAKVAERVSKVVLTPNDREVFRFIDGIDFPIYVTCVFSIKECLYKALSELADARFIGFRSIDVIQLDLERNQFSAQVPKELGILSPLCGRIMSSGSLIHTEYFHKSYN